MDDKEQKPEQLIEISEFYNRLVDQDWYLSLSELDVEWDCHYPVSSGASLAAMHAFGFTHGDFHASNLFYTPVTGYGGVVDPDTLKLTELNVQSMFGEFIPAFLTMTPEFFKAFLVGYFKSACILLDQKRPGFSQELLVLTTLNSHLLVDGKESGSQQVDIRGNLAVSVNSDSIFVTENIANGSAGQDTFLLRWAVSVLRATNTIAGGEIPSIQPTEMSLYLKELGIDLPDQMLNQLVASFNSRDKLADGDIGSLFADWISLLKEAIGNEQLHFWGRLIAALDEFSLFFDGEIRTNPAVDGVFYRASVTTASLSMLLLKDLSDISEEIRSFEQLELSVRKRQAGLSWQVTPNYAQWKGVPYHMRQVQLDDPQQVLLDELNRRDAAEMNWQYSPQRIMVEFEYYELHIRMLNSVLSQSGLMRRKGTVKNMLWTCAYRAMAYARRNAFTMGRFILENSPSGQTAIYAHSCYLSALETLKITLLTYWGYVNEYYGDAVSEHLREFEEEYQKFVKEIDTAGKVEEYLKRDGKLFLFEGLRESIALMQEVINRSDAFPF